VVVKKVFADGSVSVKETRSSKAAPPTQCVKREAYVGDVYYDNGAEWPTQERPETEKGNEKVEKKSRGWFWN
jgi:hypothetical protein